MLELRLMFKFKNYNRFQSLGDVPTSRTGDVDLATMSMDNQRDRFELLSAYLDGELTAAQRRQVEEWLAHDPQVQQLYARLLKLRQGLRTLPVPSASQPVDETIQQVFSRIHDRSRRLFWGGAAIAAVVASALSGTLTMRESRQFAETLEPKPAVNEPLMVAINSPVIEIPKAAVITPPKGINPIAAPQ